MNLPQPNRRRGQPLFALGLIVLGWVGVRSALWAASDLGNQPATVTADREWPMPAAKLDPRVEAKRDEHVPPLAAPRPTVIVPLEHPDHPTVRPQTIVPPRIAAGHQLLFQAGTAAFQPQHSEVAAGAIAPSQTPSAPALALRAERPSRWSADAWVLWRQGGNGYNLPGRGLPGAILYSGAYGASQAGLVVRYRLAPDSGHRPALYVRASSGYDRPRGEELAAGLAARPLPKVPIAVMGEVRATRVVDATVVRPAVALVTELPPENLPFELRGEAYVQAGWVGGKGQTAFIDGQARADRHIGKLGKAELRLGGGAWIGAQRGTGRVDLGPSLRLDLPVAGINTRLSADYRIRVAGSAAPGNGAAVTFSAGF